MSIYKFSAKTIDGEVKSLQDYQNKVVLIVNTASECGFTPQLKSLQRLYEKYESSGFEVLGFPCNQFGNQDPGTNNEISSFCQKNFGVSFPMFSKVNVNGENAHPLFQYLAQEGKGLFSDKIKWNFTKFLINQDGNVIKRYAPQTKPQNIENDIKKLLE
ncbi:glutathione peroxidase [Oceanobacillus sp. Castelsardo]|uniref:glutathione peroxidase n=1 Tax=Oceanobacillus sp. Castelsardo TaxID=1851204 RepID=UPI0008399F74|nr:glutathione peroxidase [Oceanobacillus sp. Castelsardo]